MPVSYISVEDTLTWRVLLLIPMRVWIRSKDQKVHSWDDKQERENGMQLFLLSELGNLRKAKIWEEKEVEEI